MQSTGEVINNYSTNPPIRELAPDFKTSIDPITGKKQLTIQSAPAESPNLSGQQLLSIDREITGVDDPPHMLSRNDTDGSAINVKDEADLANQLKLMQQNGGFPASIFVDSRDPLIMGGTEDGGIGGAHLINVQNVFEKDGKVYVEFTNQWGQGNDHLGDRAVPVEDLYKAMEYRPAQEFTANPPQFRSIDTGTSPMAIGIGVGGAALAGAGYAAYRLYQSQANPHQFDQSSNNPDEEPSIFNFFQPNQPRATQSTQQTPGGSDQK